MLVDRAKLARMAACASLSTGLALAIGVGSALAQEVPSVQQIIEALKPEDSTRSPTLPHSEAVPGPESQIRDILGRRSRSLTPWMQKKVEEFEHVKRGINIEINFEYGSAKLARSAMPAARNLGEALTSPELRGSTFLISGHTDAKGGVEFNQRLSKRRADAVSRFLVGQYKIPAKDLLTVGLGKSELKNPSDPFGAENRRVRVTNTAANVANE